ncbi:MAG: hypothetical protein ACYS5F_12830 [Planctomycetota bacterium]
MIRVAEVYEKQVKDSKEKSDGSLYTDFYKTYDTRDCLLNLDYIVTVLPHEFEASIDRQKIKDSFPEGTKFSKVVIDGNSFRKSELIVVGSFEKFCRVLEDSRT